MTGPAKTYPNIAPLGATGVLVRFGEDPAGGANRAAIVFRAAVEREGWEGITETTTSLVSVGIWFDPLKVSFSTLVTRVETLLAAHDWEASVAPGARRWTIPVAFDPDEAPDLDHVAKTVGMSREQAIAELCAQPVQVLTIGFAPGQPYLGLLAPHWDIPRRREITPKVPAGALVVAVRQAIVFTNDTPTGWWHVGRTGFRNFRPESDAPFAFQAGDQVQFRAVTSQELDTEIARNPDGMGGAYCEALTC